MNPAPPLATLPFAFRSIPLTADVRVGTAAWLNNICLQAYRAEPNWWTMHAQPVPAVYHGLFVHSPPLPFNIRVRWIDFNKHYHPCAGEQHPGFGA